MRYLIAEDDPNLRQLWRAVLDARGHDVTEASSVSDAERALKSGTFDAMVLDLYLGRDNGLSLAGLAYETCPDCSLIVVTGSAQYERKDLMAMSPKVHSVHWKPVDIEEFQRTCDLIADQNKATFAK